VDGNYQKKLGFHKGSPARDYLVLWVEENGKWTSSVDFTDLRSVTSKDDLGFAPPSGFAKPSLYITGYDNFELTRKLTESIVTVDTLFDVFDYICKNKYMHY